MAQFRSLLPCFLILGGLTASTFASAAHCLNAFDSEAGKDQLKRLMEYQHKRRQGRSPEKLSKDREEILKKAREASQASSTRDNNEEGPSGQHSRRQGGSEALAPNTLEAGTLALLSAFENPKDTPVEDLFETRRSHGYCLGANLLLPYRENGKNASDAVGVEREKDERKRLKKICEARKSPGVDCNRVHVNNVQGAPSNSSTCVDLMAESAANKICARAPTPVAAQQRSESTAKKIEAAKAAAETTSAKAAPAHVEPNKAKAIQNGVEKSKAILGKNDAFLADIGRPYIEGNAKVENMKQGLRAMMTSSKDDNGKNNEPAAPPRAPTEDEKIAAGKEVLYGDIGKANIDPAIIEGITGGLTPEQAATTIVVGAKDRSVAKDLGTRLGLQNNGFEKEDIDAILDHPYVKQSKNKSNYKEAIQEIAFKQRMTLENAKRKPPLTKLSKQEIHEIYKSAYLNAQQQGKDPEQALYESMVQREMPPVFAKELMNNRPALDNIWNEHKRRDEEIKRLRAAASIDPKSGLAGPIDSKSELWIEANRLSAQDRQALDKDTKQAMMASLVGVQDPSALDNLSTRVRNQFLTESDLTSNLQEQVPFRSLAVQNEFAHQLKNLVNLEHKSKAEQREEGQRIYMELQGIKDSASTIIGASDRGPYKVIQLDGSVRTMTGSELDASLRRTIDNAQKIQNYMMEMGQAPAGHKVSRESAEFVKDGAELASDGARYVGGKVKSTAKKIKEVIMSSPKKEKKEKRYDDVGNVNPYDN